MTDFVVQGPIYNNNKRVKSQTFENWSNQTPSQMPWLADGSIRI